MVSTTDEQDECILLFMDMWTDRSRTPQCAHDDHQDNSKLECDGCVPTALDASCMALDRFLALGTPSLITVFCCNNNNNNVTTSAS